jgi:hypothetical protein
LFEMQPPPTTEEDVRKEEEELEVGAIEDDVAAPGLQQPESGCPV